MTARRSQRLQQKREAAASKPGSVAAVAASPESVPTPQAGSDASGSSGSVTVDPPGSVTVASPESVPTPQAGSDASGSAGSITGAPPGSVTVASPESVATPQSRSVAGYQLRSVASPRGATAPPSAGTNRRKKLEPVIRPTRPRGRPPGRVEKLPVFGPKRPRGRPPGPKVVPPPPGPKIAPPPPPKTAFQRTLEVMKSVFESAILVPLAHVIRNSLTKHYLY